jgi:hypothetical protein
MGVPADPNARPIPLYPGTPGKAIGTQREPPLPPPPQPTPMTPRLPEPDTRSDSLPVAIWADRCSEHWSPKTGISRSEFKRRCQALQRR